MKPLSNRITRYILLITLGYLCNLLLNIILARILRPDIYGNYALAIRYAEILAIICLLGANGSVTRFLPLYADHEEWGKLKGFMLRYAKLFILSSLVVITLLTIAHLVYWLNSGLSFRTFYHQHPLIFTLWVVPYLGFIQLLEKTLNSLKRKALLTAIAPIGQPLLFFIALLIVVGLWERPGLRLLIILFVLVLTIILALQLVALFYYAPPKLLSSQPRYEANRWRHTSLQLLLSLLLYASYNQIDLIMVELLDKNEHNVGVFAAAMATAAIIWVVRSGTILAFTPLIPVLTEKHDTKGLEQLAIRARNLTLIATGFAVILCLACGHWLLRHFGHNAIFAQNGYWAFIIIVLGYSFKGFFVLADSILKVGGHAKKNVSLQTYGMLISITLNALLIPPFGINGAAIALLLSRNILVIWQAIAVKRLTQVNLFQLSSSS